MSVSWPSCNENMGGNFLQPLRESQQSDCFCCEHCDYRKFEGGYGTNNTRNFVRKCIYQKTNSKRNKVIFCCNHEHIPSIIEKVLLTTSYNIGWHKSSTEKNYNSLSGCGFIFGVQTCNIIGFCVKSKNCPVRRKSHSMRIVPKEDTFCVNWDGTSGGTEAVVELELCNHVYGNSKYNIYIETIISDDDSMICPHIKHKKDVPES